MWNVLDVVALTNCVLEANCSQEQGDVNSDGTYNVLDIVALANLVLNPEQPSAWNFEIQFCLGGCVFDIGRVSGCSSNMDTARKTPKHYQVPSPHVLKTGAAARVTMNSLEESKRSVTIVSGSGEAVEAPLANGIDQIKR